MSGRLTVSLSSEALASGTEEERATFGLFAMTANDRLLTEGVDLDRGELRRGSYISGYPLAEWLAWNWWRIRWEFQHPRPSDTDAVRRWNFAHRMPAAGEGYVWPDVTISSDGLQSFLASRQSPNPQAVLFRYLGAPGRQAVPATDLETAIDEFVGQILSRLQEQGLCDTNLHRIWNDLKLEREDPELTRFRRLEAQLGYDPDEADEEAINRRLLDAAVLGEEALGEVAADTALHGLGPGDMLSAETIERIADRSGFDADPKDAITLDDVTGLPQPGQVEAWRVGEHTAQKIRAQDALGEEPIADERLADFAGTTRDAISNGSKCSDGMSFALDRERDGARVSLRPKWRTGRRFELARLTGDRLIGSRMNYAAERLLPATHAYSYRQKMQRAFAAELLSPFASVDDMLNGDYSEEKQNEVAEYFNVSPMTIQTQLVNKGRIDRENAPDIDGHGTDA